MLLNTHRFSKLLVVLFGAILSAASGARAELIPLTSVKGWPNERTSNDLPPNAIDGNVSTFTWVTQSFNFPNPSYLGVGFDPIQAGRIRLWKSPDGGGGANIKNLTIQYTSDSPSTALDLRTWQNVSGLESGFIGTELFDASAVNANGTVTGDVHDSPGQLGPADGWGSLSFDPVLATGIRIGFANPGSGKVVHYRVGEFEVHTIPEPRMLAMFACGLLGFVGCPRRRRRR